MSDQQRIEEACATAIGKFGWALGGCSVQNETATDDAIVACRERFNAAIATLRTAYEAQAAELRQRDSERADVVAKLREFCGERGDNDWPDNLHLGDVIEKHLMRYVWKQEETAAAELRLAEETVSVLVERLTATGPRWDGPHANAVSGCGLNVANWKRDHEESARTEAQHRLEER